METGRQAVSDLAMPSENSIVIKQIEVNLKIMPQKKALLTNHVNSVARKTLWIYPSVCQKSGKLGRLYIII